MKKLLLFLTTILLSAQTFAWQSQYAISINDIGAFENCLQTNTGITWHISCSPSPANHFAPATCWTAGILSYSNSTLTLSIRETSPDFVHGQSSMTVTSGIVVSIGDAVETCKGL